MNRLSEVFDRAADVLDENWREANEHGDVINCLYFPPFVETEGEAVKFAATIDDLTVDDAVDESTGTHRVDERRETVEIDFRSTLFEPLQKGKVVVPKFPGEKFSIEQIVKDDQFTTLRLYRYSTRAIQRRGVERGR